MGGIYILVRLRDFVSMDTGRIVVIAFNPSRLMPRCWWTRCWNINKTNINAHPLATSLEFRLILRQAGKQICRFMFRDTMDCSLT